MESNKTYFNFLYVLIISIAMIGSAFIIAHSIEKENTIAEKDIFTQDELLNYLSITGKELENILENDEKEKKSIQSKDESTWYTYQFLPYLEIENKRLFIKSEVDSWLKYKSDLQNGGLSQN